MCAELRKGQEEEERLDPSVKQGIRLRCTITHMCVSTHKDEQLIVSQFQLCELSNCVTMYASLHSKPRHDGYVCSRTDSMLLECYS